MNDVLAFKTCVPFKKYTGSIGRHAQAKLHKAPVSKGRWPVKATAFLCDPHSNAISNSETKGLDTEQLYVSQCYANRAPPGRRKTFRAHGRIGVEQLYDNKYYPSVVDLVDYDGTYYVKFEDGDEEDAITAGQLWKLVRSKEDYTLTRKDISEALLKGLSDMISVVPQAFKGGKDENN